MRKSGHSFARVIRSQTVLFD